jgi:hypothetical protein
VVEGLAEGQVALVFKVHHSLTDGVSAALLLLRLLDSSSEGAGGNTPHARVQPATLPTRVTLLAHAVSRLPRRSANLVRLLRSTAGSVAGMARSRMAGAPGGPWMPMPFSAPRTPWNQATSSRRTVAFGRARLADISARQSTTSFWRRAPRPSGRTWRRMAGHRRLPWWQRSRSR